MDADSLNLYRTTPEIQAAVRQVADLAMYARLEGENLDEKLIEFFGQYDRARTDQVNRLKAELADGLMRSLTSRSVDPSRIRDPGPQDPRLEF